MAIMEQGLRSICGCDVTTCTAPDLEEIKFGIGSLCCNQDWLGDTWSNLAPGEPNCSGVTTMTFEDYWMHQTEEHHTGGGSCTLECKDDPECCTLLTLECKDDPAGLLEDGECANAIEDGCDTYDGDYGGY